MYINNLTLANFRNYERASLELANGINIFRGANAQGKTNLIEAVFFCCVGRSPRTPRDKELIRWQEKNAYIKVSAKSRYGKKYIETYVTAHDKRVAINGLGIKKIGELMGEVRVVFFSPDELKIIKDGPSDRRKFLDIDISQLDKSYFYELNRYNRIIAQRNKLLKSGRVDDDSVHVWDLQLARSGTQIALKRKAFIERLQPAVRDAHAYLTDGAETPDISYESGAVFAEDEYLDGLKKSLERDKMYGHTSFGVHKDDFCIITDGIDLRSYGSQGQQRTSALALKLGELKIFEEDAGEKPILILDDVLSELDKTRQQKLLMRLNDTQTLLTCTHADIPLDNCSEFLVENGKVKQL